MSTPAEKDVNPLRATAANVEAAPVVRAEHQEDLLTRMIEHQAARIPSNVFLFSALCAMAYAAAAELSGRRRSSRFVGMWVGPLLTMGVYNKLVKTLGPR
jgi:hypothetical protein